MFLSLLDRRLFWKGYTTRQTGTSIKKEWQVLEQGKKELNKVNYEWKEETRNLKREGWLTNVVSLYGILRGNNFLFYLVYFLEKLFLV